MKSRSLVFLSVAVVALGGYALFDFIAENRGLEKKAASAQLVTLKKDQITEIKMQKQAVNLLLRRGTDGWRIEEPVQDWADSEAVDIFLTTAENEVALEIPVEGENIDWKRYGLDKPLAIIEFTTSSGEKAVYQVSTQKNFEQNTFLRKNDEKKVYLVRGTWQARAEKGVAELRDMRMLRHTIGSVTDVDFKTPAAHLHLQLQEGQWQLTDHPQQKIDQQRVLTLLEMIADTRASKIISAGPLSSKDKVSYFLKSPLAELNLQMGDKKWQAFFGTKDRKELYAWVSDPAFLLQLELGEVDKFFKVKSEDFFAPQKKSQEKK